MAGDWIKWVKGLTDRREVVRISSALKADRLRTASALMVLWEWADDETDDGRIDGIGAEFLDEKARTPGLAAAMAAEGWLEITAQGVVFPRFTRHNGDSAKRRATDAERKRVRRMSASEADISRTECGPEKRREEKSTPPISPKGDVPAKRVRNDYSPEFEAAWNAYPPKGRCGKAAAARAYERVLAAGRVTHANLLERVTAFAASPKGRGEFVPHLATWLNQGRYEDSADAWQDRGGDPKAAARQAAKDKADTDAELYRAFEALPEADRAKVLSEGEARYGNSTVSKRDRIVAIMRKKVWAAQ